ncbi:helix-turn-helix domain-containing protein [Paenibacillus agricola]|uniref:Helix-turn-helix transcriptional regulator n=1 Tax=Paenibacillus agricola TaxID=2716264 RepID=A0ABX0JC24_9BACL|nr:helix-turn-helix transcriptional regulator [Paenibacillus agricola]NHN33503.1 helix-turn-helix transcriptional regulator [Paenibacillus agricola]
MNLGQRIAALRNHKHLTQDKMAEILGVKRARYNAWENGISNPDITMLAAIANYHQVTVDFLLGLPHPKGINMLTSDMYADGYTDESVFEELEARLKTIPTKENTPEWATAKDKRDLLKMLEAPEALFFDGVEFDESDRAKMIGVMETIFWDAKKRNKEDYKKSRGKNKES